MGEQRTELEEKEEEEKERKERQKWCGGEYI